MNIHQNRKGFTLTKDDFVIDWYSGTGAGGQHRNKHQNCCRITHPQSGVTANGTGERSRESNKAFAFKSLANNPKFKSWMDAKLREIETGQSIEEEVEKSLSSENLKFEILVNGKWTLVPESELSATIDACLT